MLNSTLRNPTGAALLLACGIAAFSASAADGGVPAHGPRPSASPAAREGRKSAAARPDVSETPPDPATLAAHAVNNDIKMLAHNGMYLRYRMRKVDGKGDTLREVIETRDGTVARILQKDGRDLTPAEAQAEMDRLNSMMAHPAEYAAHQKRDQDEKDRAQRLLQTIPQALIFEAASPQEPVPGAAPNERVVELTFRPNPSFQPPTVESQALKAMKGKVWIDTDDEQIAHLEVQIFTDAAFGWGLLGKVYHGGNIVMDQADAGDHHWIMTHLRQKLTIRALFRTMSFNVNEDIADFTVLKNPMSYQEGIKALQSLPAQ